MVNKQVAISMENKTGYTAIVRILHRTWQSGISVEVRKLYRWGIIMKILAIMGSPHSSSPIAFHHPDSG